MTRDLARRQGQAARLTALLRVIGPEWESVEVVWSYAVPGHGRGFMAYHLPDGEGGFLRPMKLGDRYPFARARVGELRCGELAPEAWEVADRVWNGIQKIASRVVDLADR
jgi:hypothetical protein